MGHWALLQLSLIVLLWKQPETNASRGLRPCSKLEFHRTLTCQKHCSFQNNCLPTIEKNVATFFIYRSSENRRWVGSDVGAIACWPVYRRGLSKSCIPCRWWMSWCFLLGSSQSELYIRFTSLIQNVNVAFTMPPKQFGMEEGTKKTNNLFFDQIQTSRGMWSCIK